MDISKLIARAKEKINTLLQKDSTKKVVSQIKEVSTKVKTEFDSAMDTADKKIKAKLHGDDFAEQDGDTSSSESKTEESSAVSEVKSGNVSDGGNSNNDADKKAEIIEEDVIETLSQDPYEGIDDGLGKASVEKTVVVSESAAEIIEEDGLQDTVDEADVSAAEEDTVEAATNEATNEAKGEESDTAEDATEKDAVALSELGFSSKVIAVLAAENLATLADVKERGIKEVAKIKGVGKVTVDKLKSAL